MDDILCFARERGLETHVAKRDSRQVHIILLSQRTFCELKSILPQDAVIHENTGPKYKKVSEYKGGRASKQYVMWEPFDAPYGRVLLSPHRSSAQHLSIEFLKAKTSITSYGLPFGKWLETHQLHIESPYEDLIETGYELALFIRYLKRQTTTAAKESFKVPPILPLIHNHETGRRLQLYLGDDYRGSPANLHLLVAPDNKPIPPFEVQGLEPPPKKVHHKPKKNLRKKDPLIAYTSDHKTRFYYPKDWSYPIGPQLEKDMEVINKLEPLRETIIRTLEKYNQTPIPDWLKPQT